MKFPFKPRIALFAYHFSHWKSEALLENCISNNIDVAVVLAAPKYNLSTKEIIEYESSPKLKYLCDINNINLIQINHEDFNLIQDIINLERCNLGLIGGARRIKPEVIKCFEYGILNYHPGLLPDTAGLNAIERAIIKGLPINISFHIINEKLDDGLMLLEQNIPIKMTDSINEIKKRNLEFQVYLNSTVIKLYSSGRLDSYPINRTKYNQKMNMQEDLKKLERQQTDVTVRAPQSGMILNLHSLYPGAVISPGNSVVTLVPTGVELLTIFDVDPSDISKLIPDTSVKIQLNALPAQKHGELKGKINYISADTVNKNIDGQAGNFYRARAEITENLLKETPPGFNIMPGMKVSGKIKLIGVTILTSLDNKALKEIGFNKDVKKIVYYQAKLASKAKLDAIVCSAKEVKIVKKVFKKEIITPGIRFSSNINDQKRTLTPKQAYRNGADWLVIGRDITKGNIKKNIQTLIDHLNQ